MSDYLELNLYLNEEEEATTTDLYVYIDTNKCFLVQNVNSDPIRYQGWWTIPHLTFNVPSTVHVEADKVLYFKTITKDDYA